MLDGYSTEELDEERRVLEFVAEPSIIWDENWLTACVFLSLNYDRVVYPGRESEPTRLYPVGVSTWEIERCMVVHGIPRAQRLECLYDVRAMVIAALPHMQKRISAG